ncbi:hypothetical protein CONPUDRAFT_76890 [Coniophora puteana RWD-64-598 SS2]|uniref:Uncharacterized protein n=1 Tax=Coniophora puteana (strain RWD-64-598) TaxID=741705 RepID=A0A5M3M9R0_CONPW|nr:uncharacterized protein CONPUDRAFT_76890 [Coniophora puteana RWD-64-598 SS2]EIW75827.1 hypothetical protein CONPUDRAFT_76890 [Coniophora puteana RWD-64-598 SS2]
MAAADLPSEILYAIFEECATLAHEHDRDDRPWQAHLCKPECLLDWIYVTHVCRHWRAAAFSWSPLWTRLVLVSKPWANALLSRSGTIPVSISTDFKEKEWDRDIVLENLSRIKELVLGTSNFASLEEIFNVLGTSDPDHGTIMLESLSITTVDPSDYPNVMHVSPNVSFANDHKLRRLHLDFFPFGLHFMALDGMQNLVELSISGISMADWFDELEGRTIHLPRLSRLHIADGWEESSAFLAALQYSNPLHYLGLDTGGGASTKTLLQCILITLGRYHAVKAHKPWKFPLTISGYYYALGIDVAMERTGDNETSHSTTFCIEAIQSSPLNSSQLHDLRKKTMRENYPRLTSVSDGSPGFHFSSMSALDDALRFFGILSAVFPVSSIVALTISRKRGSGDTISASVLSIILMSLPNLATFLTCRTQLSNIVLALLPRRTGSKIWPMPALRLRELSLSCIDDVSDIGVDCLVEDQPRYNLPATLSLSKCLAYRSNWTSLDRLSLTRCASIDENERVALRRLKMIVIEDELLNH